jgi:hypothetical protein
MFITAIPLELQELATYAVWIFSAGMVYMSHKNLAKELVFIKEDREKSKNITSGRFAAIAERQEVLELRHITAMEKLGDAMAIFSLEVRDKIGDHTSRINYLEKTSSH